MSRDNRIRSAHAIRHAATIGFVALSLFVSFGARAGQFHVTTSGSQSGSGSASDPWSLAHALSHPSQVSPGDTIWVHEGVYIGSFVSNLLGTSARPIILRN